MEGVQVHGLAAVTSIFTALQPGKHSELGSAVKQQLQSSAVTSSADMQPWCQASYPVTWHLEDHVLPGVPSCAPWLSKCSLCPDSLA